MDRFDVAIIERRGVVRDGLAHILSLPPFSVVAAGRSLAEVMAGSEAAIKPAIVLFGSSSEAEIAVRIKENLAWSAELLPAKRVMLTGVNDAAPLRVAIAGGLDALFLEEVSAVVLRRSLELVLLGERLYPAALFDASQHPVPGAIAPSHAPAMKDGAPGKAARSPMSARADGSQEPSDGITLSEREAQILRHIVRGFSNKSIARELKITEATVKVHVKGVLRKTRASNRMQAAIWAIQNISYINDPSGKIIDLAVAGLPKKARG